MKNNISIQLKALLLLIVFSSNTVVGIACSVGADMWFNITHHHDDDGKVVSVHVHADGKKHQHHDEEVNNVLANPNAYAILHHHDDEEKEMAAQVGTKAKKHHYQKESEEQFQDKKDDSQKDDCCNDKVAKITQSDKALAHSNGLTNPVFFTAFIYAYYNIGLLYPSQVTESIRYFVRGHHPPISDIRIAIQSFQI